MWRASATRASSRIRSGTWPSANWPTWVRSWPSTSPAVVSWSLAASGIDGTSSSVALPDPHRDYVRPAGFALPPEGLGLRQMRSPLAQEDWAVNRRLPAAQAFARANGVDRVVIDAPRRVLSHPAIDVRGGDAGREPRGHVRQRLGRDLPGAS